MKDLEDIQKEGGFFFRKHFGDNFVYNGNLFVPYLCEFGDEVVLHQGCLGGDWCRLDPALRLASSSKPSILETMPSTLIINGVRYVKAKE